MPASALYAKENMSGDNNTWLEPGGICVPQYHPFSIDWPARALLFLRMEPSAYTGSAFLDTRIRPAERTTYRIPVEQLLKSSHQLPEPHSLRLIMHTAFCCSTLLARCLEICTDCLVLKEPLALTQLADSEPGASAQLSPPHAGTSTQEWSELLGLLLRLYGQTYTSNSGVIIKTNDRCITLGEEILQRDSNSRLLFLYVDLRSFALAGLRGPERRAWLHNAYQRVMQTDGDRLPAHDKSSLSDGERAAIFWLARVLRAQGLRKLFGQDRVGLMDGNLVAQSPGDSVQQAARHLDLPIAIETVAALEGHTVLNRHAKETSRAYDAATRDAELARWNGRAGAEIDDAVAWLTSLLEEHANLQQGFRLFDGQLGTSIVPLHE